MKLILMGACLSVPLGLHDLALPKKLDMQEKIWETQKQWQQNNKRFLKGNAEAVGTVRQKFF